MVSKKGTENLNLMFLEAALNLSGGFEKENIIFLFLFFGHTACGILVPRPGINPVSPVVEASMES